MKKKTIIKIKKNHSQYWNVSICTNHKSECINEGDAMNGSGYEIFTVGTE